VIIETLTPAATLAALGEGGYTLSLQTKKVTYEYKGNVVYQTYADTLKVRGDEPPPDEVYSGMHEHAVYLKAAVAVSDPPVAWIAETVRRYITGEQTEINRGGKKVHVSVTLDSLASNIVAFLELDRVRHLTAVRSAIRDELSRKDLARKISRRAPRTITVREDDKPPKCKKEPYQVRQRRLKDEEDAGLEYERLVAERLQRWEESRRK